MTTSLEIRRRRALWRASHRGTKELDWLLGRFADARVPDMSEAQLARFEQLIALPEPELQEWLINGARPADSDLGTEIDEIRAFHGL